MSISHSHRYSTYTVKPCQYRPGYNGFWVITNFISSLSHITIVFLVRDAAAMDMYRTDFCLVQTRHLVPSYTQLCVQRTMKWPVISSVCLIMLKALQHSCHSYQQMQSRNMSTSSYDKDIIAVLKCSISLYYKLITPPTIVALSRQWMAHQSANGVSVCTH